MGQKLVECFFFCRETKSSIDELLPQFHYVNVGETNEQGEFVVHKAIAVEKDNLLLFRVHETDNGTASVGLIPGATKKDDVHFSTVEPKGPSTTVKNQCITTDQPFKMKHHIGEKYKDHIVLHNEDIPNSASLFDLCY